MPRTLLVRAWLFLAPFAVWFLWRAWAARSGRPMGSTPWSWLAAIGAVLLGGSVMASALFRTDNRGETYVPGEVGAGGAVSPGRFVPAARPPR
ncbi:hypothetical protein [Phenylobacterium sp.]|uniref:hypothetical protein n=1 Tax=Phenylobacterium sp. TaxID=1871053 RepID=UPI002F3F6942